MNKRVIILILLFVSVIFYSCSSQKHVGNYAIQSETTKRMMKENEKMSKKNTPIRKKKTSLFERRTNRNMVDQNMLNDGVMDVRQ